MPTDIILSLVCLNQISKLISNPKTWPHHQDIIISEARPIDIISTSDIEANIEPISNLMSNLISKQVEIIIGTNSK